MSKEQIYMDVAEEYGRYLGGRFKGQDGEFTGGEFRDDYLIPKLNELKSDQVLVLDFKGCVPSVGTSFLDEAFIQITKKVDHELSFLENHIVFKNADYMRDKIKLYGGPEYKVAQEI